MRSCASREVLKSATKRLEMSPYMYCVTCSDQCIVVSWSLSVFWIVEENAIDDYKD